MRIQSFLLATFVLSAGLVSAQRGGGRAGGQMPGGAVPRGGPAQTRGMDAGGRAAKAPKGADAAHTQHTNIATSHLQRNPALEARLAPMLPAGMTVEQAAVGYKNWGQFVAAVNVSKNLNIPFVDLQSRMTGPEKLSLGKAVHELRPDLSDQQVRDGVRAGEREAKQLEREAKQLEREAKKGPAKS